MSNPSASSSSNSPSNLSSNLSPKLFFNYATISGRGNWPQIVSALRNDGLPEIEALGGHAYGLFAPQFGLAANQLVLITQWDRAEDVGRSIERTLLPLAGIDDVAHRLVVPTARPKNAKPPQRAGVYVHRFFDLPEANVDEVVELSAVAWETFEEAFDVEIIGFFRTLDTRSGSAELMLLNWYPTLAAWEASRNFEADPESRKRFMRRAEITDGTYAISTTLVP